MQKATEHIGETRGMKNHDHDLVHELSNRLDALWRYDQYEANAEGKEKLQEFWSRMREQEKHNVGELKELLATECKEGCF